MEDVSWFLTAYSKMQEERDKLRKETAKRNLNMMIWEFHSLSILQDMLRHPLKSFIKGLIGKPSGKA